MAAPPPRVKVKNAIVSLLLVAALVITGALAFLTAKDSAENKFTVGNVDISLTEPLWDAANPDGTLENIVAGQVITKDPTITNTGVNNAYVYFQVEIPKVYKTDITGADDTATEMTDYPLFTMQTKNGDTATDLVAFDAEGKPYSTNEDFVIVDSFIDDTQKFAYDYYLFAYVGETEPEDTVKLFDQIQFANITDKFENLANGTTDAEGNTTFPAITNLQVNVKAYAIQSDFYNNEAGEEKSAENAWSLYVNQNDWKWEPVNYEGISTMSFVNEDDQVVYTESGYAGTPVEMYFEPSLAKTGYTFDWVNEDTGDVAYSGMPMPETDTTLTASYTETGYGTTPSDFLEYMIYKDDNGELYASVIDADISHENFPTSPTTIIIPSYVIYQKETTEPEVPVIEITTPNAANVSIDKSARDIMNALSDGTINIPVKKVSFHYGKPELSSVMETLVIPDTVTSVMGLPRPNLANEGNYTLKSVNIPYSTTYLHSQLFMNFTALESVQLPQTLTTIENLAFWGSGIKDIIIPQSVQVLGREVFRECKSLETIEMPLVATDTGYLAYECTALKTVIIHAQNGNTLGKSAFSECTNLETVILPEGLKVIEENTFYNATKLTNITLPNSLEAVKNFAFYGTSLTSVSVTDICVVDNYAFPSTCTVTYH